MLIVAAGDAGNQPSASPDATPIQSEGEIMPVQPTPSRISRGDERVRTRAYFLWEAGGRPLGRNDEFWSLAHIEVAMKDEERITQAAMTDRAAAE